MQVSSPIVKTVVNGPDQKRVIKLDRDIDSGRAMTADLMEANEGNYEWDYDNEDDEEFWHSDLSTMIRIVLRCDLQTNKD